MFEFVAAFSNHDLGYDNLFSNNWNWCETNMALGFRILYDYGKADKLRGWDSHVLMRYDVIVRHLGAGVFGAPKVMIGVYSLHNQNGSKDRQKTRLN